MSNKLVGSRAQIARNNSSEPVREIIEQVISYGFACKDYGFIEAAAPGSMELPDAEIEAKETLQRIIHQIERLTGGD